MNTDRDVGVLLLAHGARDPNWARPFEAVAAACRQARGDTEPEQSRVALSFLEFMAPDMVDAGSQLVARGCRTVAVVPLFLGAGGHVRKDVPVLLQRLQALHPQVRFELQTAVGESELLVQAMAQLALQAAGRLGASLL